MNSVFGSWGEVWPLEDLTAEPESSARREEVLF